MATLLIRWDDERRAFMKRGLGTKILSFALSLAMLVTLARGLSLTASAADSYQLWVGGEEVTSDKLSGEGWSFGAEDHTLTLTDYNSDNACYIEPEAGVYDPDHGYRLAAGIYYAGTDKLTVALVGTNVLTMPAFSEDKLDNAAIFSKGDLTFTGAGSLNAAGGAANDSSDKSTVASIGICFGGKTVTFEGSGAVSFIGGSGENSYGAYAAKSGITVTGAGQVTFAGGAASKKSVGYYGGWGGVTVTDGGKLTAVGGPVTGAGGESFGLYNGLFSITVQNGSVDACGGAVEGDGGRSYGLYSAVGPVYLDDGAKVDCRGRNASGAGGKSFGIRCAGIYVSGGDLVATGASANESCGVYNDISMRIAGGTVTANGGSAARSYGIYSGDQIEVSAGVVTAAGHDAAENSSGLFLAARTFTDGTVDGSTLTVTGGDFTATGGAYGVFCDPLFDGKVIVITDGTVTASGKTVSMSKAPILGANVTASGSAAFDGSAPSAYDEKNSGAYKWVKTVGDPHAKTLVTELIFTVEEPVVGAVPAKTIQIASVPENALSITEYDAVWLESDDSLEYEAMSSPTFEAGKYYALMLPDENNAGGPVIALAAPGYAVAEDPVYTVNGANVFMFMSFLDIFGPLEAGAVPVAEEDIKEIYGNAVCFTGVEGQEYIIVPKGVLPTEDDWLWQNGKKIPDAENEVMFSDLEPITEYEIYTRVAESGSAPAGSPKKTEVMTVLEGFGIGSEGFGNALVGETFQLYPDPESDELTFQWYTFEEEIEFGETPTEITPIPGATDTAYTLKADDAGKRFGAKAFKNGKEVGALFWTDMIGYATVSFDSAGGSSVAPLTGLNCGAKIKKPSDPIREGYAFDGWYQEEEYETPWDFDEDLVGFAEVTLYAKWTPVVEDPSVPGQAGGDGDQRGNSGNTASPKTGDNSHPGLWILLLGLSLCGLAATHRIGKKKRAFDK